MNKKIDISFCILIYSILFLPKIGFIDLKLIVLGIYLIIAVVRRRKLQLNEKSIYFVIALGLLASIFLCNSLLNDNTSYLILLRYLRCAISIICIYNYIKSRSFSNEIILRSVLFVILLHAITVIFCILIPSIKPYIALISGYSKKELPLRSSGLMSGYDFAGFVINTGFIISVFYNIKYKNKVFSLISIIYIIAILFTSRLNTVFLIIQVICLIFYILKTHRLTKGIGVLIIVPIILVGSIFTIITIDVFSPIRDMLILKFPWVATLDATINNTYSESNLIDNIHYQYQVLNYVNILIGNGTKAPTDPGIINTIYESGVIGIIIKTFAYLQTGIYCFRHRKLSIAHAITAYLVVVSTFFEIKLIFYFATSSFELLILFYSIALNNEEQLASLDQSN